MAPGIVLIILGAIFAFAVRAESSWLDVQTVGLILIVGGGLFIWRSLVRRRVVTTEEVEHPDADTERTTVVERRVE